MSGSYWQEVDWRRDQMPLVVTLLMDVTEANLRQFVRGGELRTRRFQKVIVAWTREADRVIREVAHLKMARDLPYGGALSERYLP